jgi:hypothetical protein
MRCTTTLRAAVAILSLSLAVTLTPSARASGGAVLPPDTRPHGLTLTDLAADLALFTTSFNNPQFYPNTPLQVLFADPNTIAFNVVGNALVESGSNTITVKAGTTFYMPLFNVDDSPPIVGNFPTDARSAVSYVFDDAQLGLDDVQVTVDGQTTNIGPAFLVGPIQTPPLNDGGGTHIITLGVFLSPLSVGTHTVSFTGHYDGALVGPAIGFPTLAGAFTYTVRVVP